MVGRGFGREKVREHRERGKGGEYSVNVGQQVREKDEKRGGSKWDNSGRGMERWIGSGRVEGEWRGEKEVEAKEVEKAG